MEAKEIALPAYPRLSEKLIAGEIHLGETVRMRIENDQIQFDEAQEM